MTTASSSTYKDVLQLLYPPNTPVPLLAGESPKPHNPKLASKIAALEVHPTLEALLHLLNRDLSSAHFLVRHMESPPCYEGMTLHGMLHRIEGDIENARCWYLDVMHSDIFAAAWSGIGTANSSNGDQGANTKMSDYSTERNDKKQEYDSKPDEARAKLPTPVTEFLDRIQRLRAHVLKSSANPLPAGTTRADEEAQLSSISAREIKAVREFCESKFGTERCPNALESYVGVREQRGEIGEKKEAMLVGGEGFRHF